MGHHIQDRRAISARNAPVFQSISRFIAQAGVSPNTISISSVFFAIGAGVCLLLTRNDPDNRVLWMLAALCIPLRLIANMLDGMVAVDSGKFSPVGELFNEVPDRVSDVFVFVCAGYAFGGDPFWGYTVAILALFIAYVRALGNTMGVTQLFLGPMAKSHRMFTLIGACLYNAIAPVAWQIPSLMLWVMIVIGAGGVITIARRLQKIVVEVGS